MKIYTRTGDRGLTSLGNGKRVSKTNPRVEIIGSLDELNSLLGLALCFAKSPESRTVIPTLQNLIFNIGAQIGDYNKDRFHQVNSGDVKEVEKFIDQTESRLKPLRNFILPGGSKGASFLQITRTVCRRLERLMVKEKTLVNKLNPSILTLTNRTSDLLFSLARLENLEEGIAEKTWPL